jgi:uncharacterized protein HemY
MQKKWDESTLQFMVFLRVIGPIPSAYTQIGFNFNKQLDWKNAQLFLEKSVSLQPDNVNARIYLSEAFAGLGKKEKARKQLQAISKPNPSQSAKISKLMINLTNPKNTTP